MKFVLSSPDTLLFDRSEFSREMTRGQQIGLSMLALLGVAMLVGLAIRVPVLIGVVAL